MLVKDTCNNQLFEGPSIKYTQISQNRTIRGNLYGCILPSKTRLLSPAGEFRAPGDVVC